MVFLPLIFATPNITFPPSVFPICMSGHEFDFVFDWTILKYQQSQKNLVQPSLSPVPGASNRHAVAMDVDNHQGHGEERIRSGNATGSGVKVQFKSPAGRNLSSDNPRDKNIFGEANMASASYSPAGTSKRNPLNPALSAEPSNTGHGQASKIGPSSSWMSSLQRISSSK